MVTLSVRKHNARNPGEQIRSVLCPGLGTDVGMMDQDQCANQVRTFISLFKFNHNTKFKAKVLINDIA